MAEAAVIVFARVPHPGRVKTRLIPALGEQGALRLYLRLLEHTLEVVADAGLPGLLYGTGSDPVLTALAQRHGMSLRHQRGEGLGERMVRALREQHQGGYRRLLLIGSDCPVLTPAYLEGGLAALRDADYVLGPAEDGGYVLIGSRDSADWSGDALKGVRFGGDRALADSRQALAARGRVRLLESLWDIDDPGDWLRARKQGLLD